MKDRLIMHIDINYCYAQIEEMMNPHLKDVPMCVGGDEKKRSGIVLARNLKAKEYGITTAETLRDAYRKCPHLVVVPAHYDKYIYYTTKIKDIYKEYSDLVESYGLDEAWIDITHSYKLFGKPYDIPFDIQKRIYDTYKLTVSVGVSWNKVYAKLGSDLIKPYGMVFITRANYQEKVYPLPVEELLFIGRKTKPKLNRLGIYTIGDLAHFDETILAHHFGILGEQMQRFASGSDTSLVNPVTHVEIPKSIGNSTTPPHDMHNVDEAAVILRHLCDSVASRLRDENMVGSVISMSLRTTELDGFTRQRKIKNPTQLSDAILRTALDLLELHYDFNLPLRSIGVNVSNLRLKEQAVYQLSMVDEENTDYMNRVIIDETIDALRKRFGHHVIKRASALLDKTTQNFDAKHSNTIYPARSKDFDLSTNPDNKILLKRDTSPKYAIYDYLRQKGEF